MKPLIVLVGAFGLAIVYTWIFNGKWDHIFAGNLAMTVMLVFTAIGHFAFTKGMTMMLPAAFPFKKGMIYMTGLIELAAAIGLLIPSVRHITALLLILFFIAILPANFKAARQKINLEQASYEGQGLSYLWFRIPLQLFFIAWVGYFSY